MHVGYSAGFQNPGNALADGEVVSQELRLVDIAVNLGFDSVWALEHHFTDYFLCPDPLQLLTWLGARYPDIRLGTGVIVLPWHEPVRCAEQIAVLDNLTGGRLILGIGRGIGTVEYEGFRVDMNTSRERFIEWAGLILDGLESGVIEGAGEFATVPRKEIRPRPERSFRGRTYAGAMSPDSMPVMARLGIGLLVIPQKPWAAVREDLELYRTTWSEAHGAGSLPPAPMCAGNVVVHADAARAEELAYRYIGGYYETVMKHYQFGQNAHAGVKGYEYYAGVSRYIDKRGADGAVADYVGLMPWGTPDQVLEKCQVLREHLGISAFNPTFSFAGMPYDESEANLRLFATEVLPVLKSWEADPLADVVPSGAVAAFANG
jgi:alkanesulfonate monooxygenase SsuD/methylene tetrahydromethanopterin reductase-like flavin-dependent oxidoreductase (luciferase family)